jgi:biotin carboxyl carrier protein
VADEREILVDGEPAEIPEGWEVDRVDPGQGVALVRHGDQRELVAVEGRGRDRVVTRRGRRIPVEIRSHRDRLLAEAATSAGHRSGAAEVRASLPGLVVRVSVAVGDEVAAGDPLVTIEAMKMQNELRAPHDGRVTAVEVAPGQAISGGTLLVRLADPEP